MNDQEIKKKLALYLEATEKLHVQSGTDNAINVDEQKKLFYSVITDMGVSPKEYEELEKIGQQFFTLAKESYQASNYKQSVHFCTKALEIMPFEVEILEVLMDSHLQLSQSQEAQIVSKSILRLQPSHKEALRITHQLPTSSSSANGRVWTYIVGVFLLMTAMFIFVNSISSEKEKAPAPVENPVVNIKKKPIETQKPKSEVPAVEKVQVEAKTPDFIVQTDSIPVSVFGIIEGVTLENRESEFSKYPDSFSFDLRFALKNVGKNEIGEIEGKLILFDDKGSIVEDKIFDVKDDFEPMLRPGETYGIENLIYKKMETVPNITKAHFELRKIKQNQAPKKISKESVELKWEKTKPEQFSIKVERRVSEKKLGTESIISKVYAWNEYEVTNMGTGVIRLLKLQDDFYDEKGNHLGKGQGYVTLRSYPYIAPNETRVITIGSNFNN